jgi:23S rRNA pseudouridine2605 synthase
MPFDGSFKSKSCLLSIMEVRLQKAIAESGLCSRRRAESMIEHGHVRVNGEIAKIGMNVDPEKDKILVNGQYIRPEKKIYIMLNKPRGYLTTATDPYGRKHVLDLIHESKRVFPVGRLDRDTTGMLLLSNDGEFANRIMHPRYEVTKTYEATLDRKLEEEDLRKINAGMIIDGKRVRASAKRIAPKRVSITIHTGLNKEVKRIFKKAGYWVEALKRTEIQGVRLGPLKESKYRHLVDSEIKKLLQES